MNQVSRNIALWLVVALIFLLLFNFFSRTQQRSPEIIFSDFLNQVEKGEVSQVTIQGNVIQGDTSGGANLRLAIVVFHTGLAINTDRSPIPVPCLRNLHIPHTRLL